MASKNFSGLFALALAATIIMPLHVAAAESSNQSAEKTESSAKHDENNGTAEEEKKCSCRFG